MVKVAYWRTEFRNDVLELLSTLRECERRRLANSVPHKVFTLVAS